MKKIKMLEQKIDKISKNIGIKYWREEEVGCSYSPPTYFARKKMVAHYESFPINVAMEMLLDYFGLEIVEKRDVVEAKIVKKSKKTTYNN